MTFRNMMMMISMTLLIGASACSTTSSAQSEAPAESAEQTQASTHEHAEHKLEGKPAEADPTKESHSMAEICPMHVEGTTRDLVQLDGAVAMDFKTTGDLDELRARVQKVAHLHGQAGGDHPQMHHGAMHGEKTQEQKDAHEKVMQLLTDVTVATEEIDGGMRMTFAPKDPAQADALFEAMDAHGQCPITMVQMPGDEPEEHSHH